MADVIYKKGQSSNLDNVQIKEGQILVTEDTGEMYIDVTNSDRKKINSVSNFKSGSVVQIDDVSPVTHNMSVKVRSKNILPYPYAETTKIESGITITDSGDGSISLSGTSTAQVNFYFSQNLQLKKGITYTLSLSGDYSFGGTSTLWIYNSTYNLAYLPIYSTNYCTFTPTEDINGIDCYLVIPQDRTVNGTLKIQLEVGSNATAYTPYFPDLTAVKVIKSNASGEAVAEYTPNADGTVNGVTSLYPNTTLMTDTEGVIIDCEYLTKSYTEIAGSTNLRNGSSIGSTRSIGSKKEDSSYKLGDHAIAEGQETTASGIASHAEGINTTASGDISHAEGYGTVASGNQSHAEGNTTQALGLLSHTEGNYSDAVGNLAHAENYLNTAGSKGFTLKGANQAAKTYTLDSVEGLAVGDVYSINYVYTNSAGNRENSNATNYGKITEINTTANTVKVDTFFYPGPWREVSTALEYGVFDWEDNSFRIIDKPNVGTRILGHASHAEGRNNQALSKGAHAEGGATIAAGSWSHSEGANTRAYGIFAHAEGNNTTASENASHAEGGNTTASSYYSHQEGQRTTASGGDSHAEGFSTTASGYVSHAEGGNTTASESFSHAEGHSTTASSDSSHAEGFNTKASGGSSHAEGDSTTALGSSSHAEGANTKASGGSSHAEGYLTTASSDSSHAEGFNTKASGKQSHAEGYSTRASSNYQHVQGKYNIEDSNNTYADIIGNGSSNNRSNAATVDWQGNAWYSGDVYVGSTSGTNKDEGSKKLATEEYVNSAISSGGGSGSNVQADWQQNDKTANDYIKNRPGGYDALTEILPETTLNFTDFRYLTLTNCPPIEVGKKYIVTFDDTEYELVGKLINDSPYIGNESLTWGSIDTGEPFFIYNDFYDNGVPKINISLSETLPCTHNIEIKAIAPVKIPEKYFDIKNTNIVNGSTEGSLRTVGSSEESSEYTIGRYAFAEGYNTTASGFHSHAEGWSTTASSYHSHAEGCSTIASNNQSHAEGYNTEASGTSSHAEGDHTIASSNYQHVQGKYNIEDSSNTYADIIGNGDETNRSNAATVDWNGNAWYAGAVTSNAADYAEFFEWLDGNPDNEDRVGYLVALDGEKIRFANPEDEILGIISANPAILGDNYECNWNGKYLTDEFGRILYDKVEEFIDIPKVDEETGEITVEKKSLGFFDHPRINPDYDPDQEYINRRNRSEWAMVGMLGKLFVRDDGTAQINGYVSAGEDGIATASTEKTNMRVLSRVNDHIVKVFLK